MLRCCFPAPAAPAPMVAMTGALFAPAGWKHGRLEHAMEFGLECKEPLIMVVNLFW